MTIKLVHNIDDIEKVIGEYPSVTFQFIDDRTFRGKKEAFKVKGHWAARITPFAVCYDDEDKPIKAFYSEDCDVIEQLKNYLNGR